MVFKLPTWTKMKLGMVMLFILLPPVIGVIMTGRDPECLVLTTNKILTMFVALNVRGKSWLWEDFQTRHAV